MPTMSCQWIPYKWQKCQGWLVFLAQLRSWQNTQHKKWGLYEVTKGPNTSPPTTHTRPHPFVLWQYSRQRVFPPHLPGFEGLVDSFLLAFSAVLASAAALHHSRKFHFLIPGARQHIVGFTILVHHNTCHLKWRFKVTLISREGRWSTAQQIYLTLRDLT